MDYQQTFAISAAGMDIERARVDVAALNLANEHTVAGVDGRLYQPLRVVAHAAGTGFGQLVAQGMVGVPVASVEATGSDPIKAYDPSHPMADARGYVSYPGIDHVGEMLNVMSALRGYEANVAAMNATRTMAMKALDIGGNS